MTPSNPPAPPPDRVPVVCAATYYDDLRDQYAFTFRIPATASRFTVYASSGYHYQVGDTYTLILAEPQHVPLPLPVEDVQLLQNCLASMAQRWREAAAEADIGAERPPQQRTAAPGHLDIEPTPSGYRSAGRLFREQLDLIQQLDARLANHLQALTAASEDDDGEDASHGTPTAEHPSTQDIA